MPDPAPESDRILYDDPRAATPETVTMWRDRHGRLWTNEAAARQQSRTHKQCERCGQIVSVSMGCRGCQSLRDAEQWAKREERPWDGVQMVYSHATERFYSSPDDAIESAWDDTESDARPTAESLQLVLCDPQYATLSTDHFADLLPEDGEAPPELVAAIEAFNSRMDGVVLSWSPGKYRVMQSDCEDTNE